MAYLSQILLAGIVTGSLYSLIAVGFAIIYKTTKVANLAHGDVSMLGAYFAVQVFVIMNIGTAISFVLLIPVSFILGAAIGLLLNIPLKHGRIANIVIASLGMGIILQELVVLKFGAFPFFLKGLLPEKTMNIGDINIQYGNLLIIAITIGVMAVMFIFFRYTELGIAMRAVSQNREASLMMGINPTVMVLSSWGLASVIGMMSCFLLSSQLGAYPELGVTVIIKAFTAAVLGGLTSLPGCVLGAFIVGIIDSLLAGYISGELQTIGAFIILLVVLLIRPEGIFSGRERVKV